MNAVDKLLDLVNDGDDSFTAEDISEDVDIQFGKYYSVSTDRGDLDISEITKEKYESELNEVDEHENAFVEDGVIVYEDGVTIFLTE
jgi:hypothetical protein